MNEKILFSALFIYSLLLVLLNYLAATLILLSDKNAQNIQIIYEICTVNVICVLKISLSENVQFKCL